MSKKRKIILITLLLLIPVSIGSYALISEIKNRIVTNSVAQYTDVEKNIGKQVSTTLYSQFSSLEDKLYALAQIPNINTVDPSTCAETFQKELDGLTVKFNNLGRIGQDKKFICSLNPGLIGVDASALGSYINDIFNDPEHKSVMSRGIKVPNVEGSVVAVHVPVFDKDGNFTGTLGGALYFEQLQNNFLKDIVFAKDGYVAVIDDNGDILFHPDKTIQGQNFFSDTIQVRFGNDPAFLEAVKKAETGVEQTVKYSLNGTEKTAVLYPIQIFPGRYWVVNVTVPVDSIREAVSANQVESLFNILLGFIILLIILTPIILLTYLISSILNPISRIISSMSKVSNGDLDEQVKYEGTQKNDEIFILTNSYNEMVQKLKKSYTILEEKVSSRTSELQSATKQLEQTVDDRTVELEEAKKDLEKKVEERTAELKSKIAEAEALNKLSVERELKMVELKEELQKLKGEK